MKVKIKGLVFVGFAAAILSANAMADDTNTVTSKAYTEATYQKKVGGTNNQLVQSTGTPGTVKYLDISENSADVHVTNGVGKVVSGAAVAGAIADVMETVNANEVSGSTYIDTDTTGDNTQVLIRTNQIANTVGLIDAGGTPLTTAGAVEDYVNVRGVKVNGSALTPDTNKDVNVTVAPGATDGTIAVNGTDVAVTNAEVTTNKLVQGENQGSVITSSATDTQYPSALAVYNALTDTSNVGNGTISATQNGVAAGSFTVNQSTAGSITIAAPNWDQATTTAADYIANKPTISNDSADITGAAATDTKELPTTYAVQQYVRSQTGGTIIPAMDTTVCTATTPCALVAEANGAVHWRVMAVSDSQATAAGTCGDVGGCGQ